MTSLEQRLERITRVGVLSPRELQILRLTADGLNGSAIAEQLWVVHETVKSHKKNIYAKLGARTAAQAVAIGFREGLLT